MGGLDQVDMAFSGIRMELKTGKKKGPNGETTRVVLDGSIRGRAQPGRMVAIMGPSGAVGCCLADWRFGPMMGVFCDWCLFFPLTQMSPFFFALLFLRCRLVLSIYIGQINYSSCLGRSHQGKFQNFRIGGRTIYQW